VLGLYKTGPIWSRRLRRHLEAVAFATLEWVDWFNNLRLLESICCIPPVEFEEAYHRSRQTTARVAGPG